MGLQSNSVHFCSWPKLYLLYLTTNAPPHGTYRRSGAIRKFFASLLDKPSDSVARDSAPAFRYTTNFEYKLGVAWPSQVRMLSPVRSLRASLMGTALAAMRVCDQLVLVARVAV